jgi:hypothetical protein
VFASDAEHSYAGLKVAQARSSKLITIGMELYKEAREAGLPQVALKQLTRVTQFRCSVLRHLTYLPLDSCCPVDVLHVLYLGIVKRHLLEVAKSFTPKDWDKFKARAFARKVCFGHDD